MASQQRQYPLRVNLSIYKLIEELAKTEDRSINYMINKLLEKQLKEDKENVL